MHVIELAIVDASETFICELGSKLLDTKPLQRIEHPG